MRGVLEGVHVIRHGASELVGAGLARGRALAPARSRLIRRFNAGVALARRVSASEREHLIRGLEAAVDLLVRLDRMGVVHLDCKLARALGSHGARCIDRRAGRKGVGELHGGKCGEEGGGWHVGEAEEP